MLGPAGVAGSVIAAGTVPACLATEIRSTLSTPPEVVAAVGVVVPASALGSEPPMARSRRR